MAFKCFLGVLLVCLAFEGIAGRLAESRLAKQLDAILQDKRAEGDCDGDGYHFFETINKCLKFGDEATNTGAKAETYCTDNNGHLAVLDNPCAIYKASQWLKNADPTYKEAAPYGYFIDAHWNSDDNNWQYSNGDVITMADTRMNWYNATTFVENSNAWGTDTRSCIRLMSNQGFMWSLSKCWNTGDTRYALCEK